MRTITAAPATCTARAANGGSSVRAFPGRSWTPCATPAVEIGIPKVNDFNRGDNEGSDYFEVNQRRGRRWSAAAGFLKPILAAAQSARSSIDAHVERICSMDGRAVGLSYPSRRREP